MKTSTLRRVRTHQRGAAMIEGIIVVSTMLVFMGLITFARQGWGMKLDLQQQTRSNTLYYASHGCTGDGGDSGGVTTSSAPTVGGDGASKAQSAGSKGPSQGATASRSMNTASATASGSTSFQYVFDSNANGSNNSINYQKKQGSVPVSAASKVACNELDYSDKSGLTDWVTFGASFASRGGGGIGDLFK